MSDLNPVNDTRLIYDSCSYAEKLKRSVGPGLYQLKRPDNDCLDCKREIPVDPAMRFQAFGPNTCTIKTAIDDSSELQGLNYKLSKCNTDQYKPDTYKTTGACHINMTDSRKCYTPREDTRLSNPPSNLRSTGINRWQWLCENPQQKAIEAFDRIPVNYRMVAKDNHVPLIETPADQSAFLPKYKDTEFDNNLNQWKLSDPTSMYAPGYPYGSLNYNLQCGVGQKC